MKSLLIILLPLLEICKVTPENWHNPRLRLPHINVSEMERASPLIDTIRQPINHFSLSSAKFSMRYAENNQFFQGSGPMFLFIGGESYMEDSIGYLYTGLMYDIAQENGAYMFLTEHRYYGQSIPNGNLHTYNLKYLTIDQALADLAYFIQDRKNAIPGLGKVVVFGGSYPGSLAAWMRLKYPRLVDAAVSASGVFNMQLDNYQYNEIVQRGINQYSGCLSTVQNGFLGIKQRLRTVKGINQVKQDYNLNVTNMVSIMTIPLYRQSFYSSITQTIDVVVQYDKQVPLNSIADMCRILTAKSNQVDAYTRLTAYIQYANSGSSTTNTIQEANSSRSWLYQLCREIGNFITTDSKNQPFGNTIPISYWRKVCVLEFGIQTAMKTKSGINYLSKTYGGLSPNVTKVVFTEGTIDPWSGVGPTKDINADAPVIVIPDSSHCAVLVPDSMVSSTALTAAKIRINQLVATWLL